jgi:hypothetical protein
MAVVATTLSEARGFARRSFFRGVPFSRGLVIMAGMRLVGVLLFVASAAAAAEPEASRNPTTATDSSFSFAWNAPASCPTRGEVLARAERLVGHTLTRAAPGQPVGLVATVEPLPNATWQLDVLSGARAQSERSVTASSCDELGDAMALLIALSIDPDYAARQGAPLTPEGHASFANPDPPPATPLSPKQPEPAPIVKPMPIARGRAEWPPEPTPARAHLALGAIGAVWAGRLPGVAPGGVLRGALSLEEWVFDVELGFFPTRHVTKGSAGADLSLATLDGSFGYALFDGLLTPYLGLELDRLHGAGTELENPQSDAVWLLGLDAGLRLSYPVHESIRLMASGRVSVLTEQARFHIDPDTELFRPARVGAQFGLGAELQVR